MCGIVGLYLKNDGLRPQIGALFAPMLAAMTERGPDSAGVAIYRNPAPGTAIKITLQHDDERYDWPELAATLAQALDTEVAVEHLSTHAVITVDGEEAVVRAWLARHHPEVRITSVGQVIEIFKEVGLPAQVIGRFGIERMTGSHVIGHTRMATESAVTTAGSHPFSTGRDLCLVHNGSLSNHPRLRDWLKRHAGMTFQTENDTEVAAAYLTYRLAEGDDLRTALGHALRDLDGFYTFAIGTRDGFAVLRDPIACKPAVLAETDDWVAMASEYRSLADLPGVESAKVWEPAPATIYAWGSA
ncbi:MAG: glutamine amidotransferase family protein [Alphaproteobacteria bacterium]